MSTERSASASLHYSLSRKVVTLASGRRLVARLLNPQDRDGLVHLLREAPEGELRLVKSEIAEPRGVEDWLERLNYRRRLPIVAVDLDAHRMMGLAPGFEPETLDRSLIDEFVLVSEAEAFEMCRRLARQQGLLVGISSGATAQAALRLVEESEADLVVVCIMADTGQRYLSVEGLFQ